MAYKLKLKADVMVYDPVERKHVLHVTTIDFKFLTASALAGLIREMVTYADDPLEFRIKKEDD